MKPPATQAHEAERIAALRNYEILDTPTEPRFDALTKLAATVLNVPIVLITFLDTDRQWFKSHYGLDVPQLPRDVLLSGQVVVAEAPLIVADTLQDPRFSDSPLVSGGPNVRFYAGAPLRTPDGVVIGTLCAIDHAPRQLTEAEAEILTLLASQVVEILGARQAERQLNQFRAALDRMIEAILIFDPTSLRFTYANDSAVSRLGYPIDELLQKTPLDFNPDFDEPRYRTVLAPLIAGQSDVTSFETMHRHTDGHDIPVEIVLHYMAPLGEQPCFIAIIRDISERKSLDELKSEFVSIVSHELRTPLTSIRGSLGLVANGATGRLPPEAQEYVNIALSNCERLVRLINDILDIEKIRSGKTELHMQRVDLGSVIKKALVAHEAYAAANNVTLLFTEDVPDADVLADEDRLLQVLAHLISNAVKFAGTGTFAELSIIKRDNRIRVNVRDHGPGIPDEFAKHIFERFAQGDSSSTRTAAGTGLGLSVAQTLIEAMLGEIGFETTRDEGTTFFFDLPALPSVQELANRSGEHPEKRVLVCEDDLDVAQLIKRVLKQTGCTVHVAPTVKRARELLAAFRYRIVTLDLMLADGDASSLVFDIRNSPVNLDVPVIIISGEDSGQLQKLEPTLIADIQQKPIVEDRLLTLVRSIFAEHEKHTRVLHVEDDPDLRQIVKRLLPEDWEIVEAATVADAKALLCAGAFDLVLLDLALPDGDGETLPDLAGDAQVVIFSASDATPALTRRVAGALVKSRTTEFQLRDQVVALMAGRQAGGKP